MASKKDWYLVAYDVRDEARLRRVIKVAKAYGERIQLSVFRVRASRRQVERLRWELLRILEDDDFLLVVGLCESCVGRIYQRGGGPWTADEDAPFALV